jgi:hypothetical protein
MRKGSSCFAAAFDRLECHVRIELKNQRNTTAQLRIRYHAQLGCDCPHPPSTKAAARCCISKKKIGCDERDLSPLPPSIASGQAQVPQRAGGSYVTCYLPFSLLAFLLFSRRSCTTTTLTLSLLPREIATSTSRDAASVAELPKTDSGYLDAASPLMQFLAILQATSFDTTSQSPSLARMRNSSWSVRSMTVTSGSAVTYGFR